MKTQMQHRVQAWQFQDVLLESYDYAPGKAQTDEPHVHADYQLCLSMDFPGMYAYRGVYHAVPKGSLSVLHPGEKHYSADPEERLDHTHYRMIYLPPRWMQKAACQERNDKAVSPYFPDPILVSDDLFCSFLHLHRLLGSAAPLLEQESHLQALLWQLTSRYSGDLRCAPVLRPERVIVLRVKTYIEDNFACNFSLTDLAQLVERHPVHLHQMFQQATGIPPHAYQTQVRIDRAKRLLACGMSIGETAQETGFYDQSHFGKYFRRYTGVTPARYCALKTS